MKSSRSPLLLSATAVITFWAVSAEQASAQGLLEALFGNKRSAPVVQEQAPPAAPKPPAAPPRVTGPGYYDYKVDALVRIDFSSLKRPTQDGAGATDQPQQQVAAQKALEDVDLTALQGFEIVAEKDAASALLAHYSENPAFIWVDEGGVSARAEAAIRILGEAAEHGLNPDDYAVEASSPNDSAALARFEMALTARVLRYARDAQAGRVDPNRISGYHDFKPKELDRAALLQELARSHDVSSLLEGFHPQNKQYAELRAELAALQAIAENDIVIADGTVIKPGQSSDEFPKLLTLIERRADGAFLTQYGELLASNRESHIYAQDLVPLIKAAQKAAGITDDGVIGPRTVQAIAGETRSARINKVLVAMEQLRWLPSDLSDRYVFINTPAFTATYVENGVEKLAMTTVVGSLGTQTYFFQDEIQYVEFHPYWGVPRSILVNKYLPKLYSDPSYLDRNGFEVVARDGRKIASSSVNWTQYGANIPYDVRQVPGRGNALGEMKIMFPNKHAIYMHDTPDKHLFARDNRALSNGCIRLADPRAMAAAVLGWDRSDIASRLERPHSRENLKVKVPVYVAYFTAWPDAGGKVEYFNDVYARDDKVIAARNKVEASRAPAS
ncbi:Murein L,D-transpeptidase YcbB/YkuD [Aquamicrobium aerolatum DSM 21857]|uniref:Murein L,D-transpeptidase YcbB/YkuD n=1 Tax=Aquamicrobium aerolatum DSM 21857 TaxID=1121003 RepID=A0A1I3KW36_9HYPH|nr:L,D-transpeptidase family protein [Aquamicrobium aerolatum]SFI76646.1 Murein L,D-transpeptidase YcbB/YkuD [Aquamicrobium aerolatum DSM 21857]